MAFLLTLSVHALALCVCVCVHSVLATPAIREAKITTQTALLQHNLDFITGNFSTIAALESYGSKSKLTSLLQMSTPQHYPLICIFGRPKVKGRQTVSQTLPISVV